MFRIGKTAGNVDFSIKRGRNSLWSPAAKTPREYVSVLKVFEVGGLTVSPITPCIVGQNNGRGDANF
jgi:hypothetical protein